MMLDIGILLTFRNPPCHRSGWAEIYRQEIAHAVAVEAQVPSPEALRATQYCESFGRSAVVGDPHSVLAELVVCHAESPGSHVTMMMSLPGMDPARTRNSLELFAREVIPELRVRCQ